MPTIVIKPDRDRDFYVGWSTVTENPHWWGPRAEVTAYIAEKATGHREDQPDRRLARADEYGTSDMSIRDGGWDDEGFVYEQRGWLPRRHLAEMCRLLEAGNDAGVWDLLEPFDDETPVRRG
jgi:hypothetical protein